MSSQNQAPSRDRVIVRTSLIGILTNLVLSAGKAAVGLFTRSIAILLDAVNNLSDALSSIITIIGAKLAGRRPDRKHPLGHGRIEYISALLVSAIVLYAGISALVESVKGIIHPEQAEYNVISLILLGVAVVVKIVLGLYTRKKGKMVNSTALVASGTDALFDAIVSASVLISALVFYFFKLSLEAYVGVLISGLILKAGFGLMLDTLNDILGRRADPALTRSIRELVTAEPEVIGVYDLFLTNYGPDKNYCSLHVELPDTMTVEQVDSLTRKIQYNVYEKTGVIITGVGVYSYNTRDTQAAEIRNRVQEIVLSHEWALQLHGFFFEAEQKHMRFDVVLSFDIASGEALKTLYAEMKEAFPEYTCLIVADVDISDIDSPES